MICTVNSDFYILGTSSLNYVPTISLNLIGTVCGEHTVSKFGHLLEKPRADLEYFISVNQLEVQVNENCKFFLFLRNHAIRKKCKLFTTASSARARSTRWCYVLWRSSSYLVRICRPCWQSLVSPAKGMYYNDPSMKLLPQSACS